MFSMFLCVVGAEAQTGQKPQDAHYCICWQPSGGQRKRCELSSDNSQWILHDISSYVLPNEYNIWDLDIENQVGDFNIIRL